MCLFPRKDGFPCGKCIDCLSKKRNDWSIRLQQEREYWLSRGCVTWMVLLTYSDKYVPKTKMGNNNLCQADVQKFLKRLRKDVTSKGYFLRYFYCGEFGPSTLRPHYHMLLFGLPNTLKKRDVKILLEKHWKKGFVGDKLGIATQRGIHYCTKYMINKILKVHRDDPEIEKPFTRMSKGLGMSFLFDVVQDKNGLHRQKKRSDIVQRFNNLNGIDLIDIYDEARSCEDEAKAIELSKTIQAVFHDKMVVNGTRFKMPRYYRDRIFDGIARYLINFADYHLYHRPKELEYQDKYGDYDSTHDIPMKILMAQEKTNRLLSQYIKSCKDDDKL